MFEVVLFCLITSVIFFSAGIFFERNLLILKNFNENIAVTLLYGFIFISFLSLILNFFFPISKNVSSIFCIFFIGYFIFKIFSFKNVKKIVFFFLILSFFSSLIIILADPNRPDSGLYHFPYTKIINENKIILGLSNIHFRFGHTSILQYLNGFNLNFLFNEMGILIPQALIVITPIIYIFFEYQNNIKNKDAQFLKLFSFFVIIFFIYSYNRYGSFGNDAAGNIFFILIIYEFLKCNLNHEIEISDFIYISLLSVFCFTLKPFLVLSFLFPLFLFWRIKKKWKEIIFSKNFFVVSIFLIVFLFKNLLVSGCLIYPSKITCFNNFSWTNITVTERENVLGDAWSKDWSNYSNESNLEPKEYIKNFIWVNTWKDNHLKKIISKIIPFLFFSILISIYLLNIKKKIDTDNNKKFISNKYILISLLITLLCLFFWFLKFPLYRYGSGFIGGFLILLNILLLSKLGVILNKKIFRKLNLIIYIVLSLVIVKNLDRIHSRYDNLYNQYPWPKIYSFDEENKLANLIPIKKQNKILFYIAENGLCMYNKEPCTYYVDDNVNLKFIKGYKIYYIDK